MLMASGPDSLTIPIAPEPAGVESAQMVSLLLKNEGFIGVSFFSIFTAGLYRMLKNKHFFQND